jgi:hypothetical protein
VCGELNVGGGEGGDWGGEGSGGEGVTVRTRAVSLTSREQHLARFQVQKLGEPFFPGRGRGAPVLIGRGHIRSREDLERDFQFRPQVQHSFLLKRYALRLKVYL